MLEIRLTKISEAELLEYALEGITATLEEIAPDVWKREHKQGYNSFVREVIEQEKEIRALLRKLTEA
jgi:hypothetical protein